MFDETGRDESGDVVAVETVGELIMPKLTISVMKRCCSSEAMLDTPSGGRDNASATRLALPSTYRISVVYSEIHAS